MMTNKFKIVMTGACMMLLLAFCPKSNQPQAEQANLIPAPVPEAFVPISWPACPKK